MGQYLIDTNIISAYFSASFPDDGLSFMDSVIDAVPNLSVITQIELLSWKTGSGKEKKVKNFLEDSIIYGLTNDVVLKCVEIRRKRKIKTPDAIIAATALCSGFTLVTNNTRDFENIKGLKVVNPYEMQN